MSLGKLSLRERVQRPRHCWPRLTLTPDFKLPNSCKSLLLCFYASSYCLSTVLPLYHLLLYHWVPKDTAPSPCGPWPHLPIFNSNLKNGLLLPPILRIPQTTRYFPLPRSADLSDANTSNYNNAPSATAPKRLHRQHGLVPR